METISAADARTRLSELLDRAAKGETFQITEHGRPVGKIVPPDNVWDPAIVAEAVVRLKKFRGVFKDIAQKDIAALKHEGHRF